MRIEGISRSFRGECSRKIVCALVESEVWQGGKFESTHSVGYSENYSEL